MAILEGTKDVASSLYDLVLDDLSSGLLAGGQRLKVAELAKRYGVSTSPVREVLRQMQGEGFVEIAHNRGAVVRKVDANTVQNISEVLHLLEPYFVVWFANFAQPEMVAEMEQIQQQIADTSVDDLQRFRKLDTEFHWSVCKRHYNRIAAESWRHYRRALHIYGAKLRISPARFKAIMAEHEALLAAFRDNDEQRANAVIRAHVSGSSDDMLQQMRIVGL